MSHFTARRPLVSRPLPWLASFFLSIGLTLTLAPVLRAESPETAPVELKTLLNQIDSAANQKNIDEVMTFYSPDFTTSEGLNSKTFSQALTALWGRYPTLKYNTELLSWEKNGDELIAETLTTITGNSSNEVRPIQLKATIKSRQSFKNQKLISQEILSERTDLMAGTNPPKVSVILPDKVRVGREFDFDVIVEDPLGDSLLAGAAIQDKIDGDRYLDPSNFDLKLLSSGGLFKRGKAPETPQNSWLSAIIVGENGITLVTQRVSFEK